MDCQKAKTTILGKAIASRPASLGNIAPRMICPTKAKTAG
jgi:hypothetical protein